MVRIGNYCYDENKDNLGEGSFGAVFKAHYAEDSKQMAAIKNLNLLKTIFRSMTPETLEREIKILKNLSANPHANLVTLLHCEQTPTNIYLVMEFCNGGDLGEYLKVKKRLDESTIRSFFKQIASGMKFLHGKGIVHRDMKPENVLLCFTGDRYPPPKDITLKIADFGIGKFLAPDATTETFCGSFLYMAPEIRAYQPYNNRVDLWSVGVMMFQCLTGNMKGAPDFLTLDNRVIWGRICTPDTGQALKPVGYHDTCRRWFKLENRRMFPPEISPSLSELLRSLLTHNPQKRLDCDKFLNHLFFGETIGISVRGPGGSKMINTNENEKVDVLISTVSSIFGLANEPGSLYLIFNGGQLEYGSGSSIKHSGIGHGSTIEFCQRLPGGN